MVIRTENRKAMLSFEILKFAVVHTPTPIQGIEISVSSQFLMLLVEWFRAYCSF